MKSHRRLTGEMLKQEYLLSYLLIDEESRDKAQENLASIRKLVYPYG